MRLAVVAGLALVGCSSEVAQEAQSANQLVRGAGMTEVIVRLETSAVLSSPATGLPHLDDELVAMNAMGLRPVFRHPPQDPEIARLYAMDRTWRVHVSGSATHAVERLARIEGVDAVAVNHIGSISAVPNDPLFVFQWHMDAIGAPDAWDIEDGGGVVVAVVDSGVDEGPFDGFGGALLEGYNAIDGSDDASDVVNHGTHVAGTIGQATDNTFGVAGVAHGADILPVRVVDASGTGTDGDLADGLVWAVDNGADVVNLSLGFPALPLATESAIQYAYDNGVTVVAASGNDGIVGFMSWPAAFDSTIAVGATDFLGDRAPYSNGDMGLDLVAPGGDATADEDGDGLPDLVWQETFDPATGVWDYYGLQGTSMATPHVAGAAALLFAQGQTDPDVIRLALTYGASAAGVAGYDEEHGFGLLDLPRALDIGPILPTSDQLDVTVWREISAVGEVTIQWKTDQPSSGEIVESISGVTLWEDPTPTKKHQITLFGMAGSYNLTLVADNFVGHDELEVTVTIQ